MHVNCCFFLAASLLAFDCFFLAASSLLPVCLPLRHRTEITNRFTSFYTMPGNLSTQTQTHTHIQTQRMREIYTPDVIKEMYPPPSAGVRASRREYSFFFLRACVHIAFMIFRVNRILTMIFRVNCLLTRIFLSLSCPFFCHSIR